MPIEDLTYDELRSELRLCASSNRRYKARLEDLLSDHKEITRQYESLVKDHAPSEFQKKYRNLLKQYRDLAVRNQDTLGAWQVSIDEQERLEVEVESLEVRLRSLPG